MKETFLSHRKPALKAEGIKVFLKQGGGRHAQPRSMFSCKQMRLARGRHPMILRLICGSAIVGSLGYVLLGGEPSSRRSQGQYETHPRYEDNGLGGFLERKGDRFAGNFSGLTSDFTEDVVGTVLEEGARIPGHAVWTAAPYIESGGNQFAQGVSEIAGAYTEDVAGTVLEEGARIPGQVLQKARPYVASAGDQLANGISEVGGDFTEDVVGTVGGAAVSAPGHAIRTVAPYIESGGNQFAQDFSEASEAVANDVVGSIPGNAWRELRPGTPAPASPPTVVIAPPAVPGNQDRCNQLLDQINNPPPFNSPEEQRRFESGIINDAIAQCPAP